MKEDHLDGTKMSEVLIIEKYLRWAQEKLVEIKLYKAKGKLSTTVEMMQKDELIDYIEKALVASRRL